MRSSSRLCFAVVGCLLALCLAGCASRGPHPGPGSALHGPTIAWPLAALAAAERVRLRLPLGEDEIWLATAPVQRAWAAASRLLAEHPGPPPTVVLLGDVGPNAFAMRHGDAGLVAVTLGMVELLGEDEAAWAALFGHEFAHLALRHSEIRQQRKESGEGLTAAMGLALTLVGMPFAAVVADATSAVAQRGYSRDDERAADRAAIAAMVRAGYDPAGAVRLFEKLGADSRSFSFLSTHPAGRERLQAARDAAAAPPAR